MRSVLHVLPHPGGGGETYVDLLERMDGYRFERVYLAPSPRPREALRALPRSALTVQRLAPRFDLIHVHGEVAAAASLPSLALRRSVVTFNGLHLLRRVDGAARIAAKANLRLIVRAASRTVCVSRSERDHALRAIGPGAARHVVVIPNGVELTPMPEKEERAEARASLGVEAGTVAAVWIGGLDDHKDPLAAGTAAIEAARGGAPLTLLVAGDGPLRPELEELALAGEGAIRVLGFQRDVRRLLAAADMFVMTSHREGLSFALLEAMAAGLPTVIAYEPSNAEAVGDTGLVVPERTTKPFTAALAELAGDETRRRELGEAARHRVETSFSAEAMVEETARLFDAVVRQA